MQHASQAPPSKLPSTFAPCLSDDSFVAIDHTWVQRFHFLNCSAAPAKDGGASCVDADTL
eukprot:3831084-Amphidinium_carterae.1